MPPNFRREGGHPHLNGAQIRCLITLGIIPVAGQVQRGPGRQWQTWRKVHSIHEACFPHDVCRIAGEIKIAGKHNVKGISYISQSSEECRSWLEAEGEYSANGLTDGLTSEIKNVRRFVGIPTKASVCNG